VWALWLTKLLAARRYLPFPVTGATADLRTTVILPVFKEPLDVFRRVLESVCANEPHEVIVVVDGADGDLMRIARAHTDKVVGIAKDGKREAIRRGLLEASESTEIVVVLDSDTIWGPDVLRELLLAFADPRVGGVTPRQAIFDRDHNSVRLLADWIEDIRYRLVVPAQSVFGQVGCLAGRTIAYRRSAFTPAVEALVAQRVLGVEMHVGDDRVLTNEILRHGWRTVYQSTAVVWTDAPPTWRRFWAQQLRWGRSSQRETLLSLRWLWRRPFAFVCFVSDIVIPFWLYAIFALAVAHAVEHAPSPLHLSIAAQIAVAYSGMVLGIGIRQIPHFRRHPADLRYLPLFVLQLTFFMAPTRIVAFATMFHNSWTTRTSTPSFVAATERPVKPSVRSTQTLESELITTSSWPLFRDPEPRAANEVAPEAKQALG
jgi:hyaluronan synthase